jgi:hypothetical protein
VVCLNGSNLFVGTYLDGIITLIQMGFEVDVDADANERMNE